MSTILGCKIIKKKSFLSQNSSTMNFQRAVIQYSHSDNRGIF